MMPKVKICGITNLQDALFCAQAGADMLGFIFYQDSPRYIRPERAAELIKALPTSVKSVGVFVNEEQKHVEEIIETTNIQVVQLSGDESPDECEGYHGVDVWKAFRFRRQEETAILRQFSVSAVMLDGAKDGEYGGSGNLPDFSVALEMKHFHPVILAGGLQPVNIIDAIKRVAPFAVDVNSGVELVPGKKDHAKVKLLFDVISSLRSQYSER